MLDLYAMPLIDLIIITVAILTVLYIIKVFNNRNRNKSNKNQILLSDNTYFDRKCYKLREQYIRLHGDSRMAAAEVLDRQIEVLKKKHPNKDMAWYIDKAIYDLKRDRRII
jgi:hypothetical protein